MPNAGKTLGPNQTLNVQVGNIGGVVPANAAVAVLNVTAINPSQTGYVSVNPSGETNPTPVSNLNFVAGQTVANLVTVPLNGGSVSIYNYVGNTNIAVDVFGYYSATPARDGSGLFNAVSPYRALGSGPSGAPIGPNTSVPVQVTGGATGVPAGATAVVVNLTAAGGTLPSYLSAYADGTTRPNVSNVNFVAGQTVANRATVPVASNGMIDVYNLQGTVNVDADISGYYTGSGGTGSAFVPITPQRLTDTRTSNNGTTIPSNSTETFNLSNPAIPTSATAVATNVTAVAGNAPGYLTVFPTSDTTPPLASDVNWSANQVVPNFTIADTAGTGNVNIYNYIGAPTDVVIDAFGYFTPPTAPVTVTANPASIPTHTGQSVITVSVAQPDGTPVAGDPVHLTSAGGTGVCGTISEPSTKNTGPDGTVSFNYTAGSAGGVCTFTATEANNAQTGTTTVTQTYNITLAPTTATVQANGVGTQALTATVTTNGTTPVPAGDVVNFSTSGANPDGACGTLQDNGTGTTNTAGQVVLNYISSSTSGFCNVTATEQTTGATSNTVAITQTAATPVATNVTVTPATSTLEANGTSNETLSATVTGLGSTPVAGDQVMFTVSPGGGTVVPVFATTDDNGVATTVYTSSTSVNTFTVTATEANANKSGTATVKQTAIPAVVTLTASPTSLPAGGGSSSTLTVNSTNSDGSPGSNHYVVLTSTGTCGTIQSPFGLTDANGNYSTTVSSAATSGFCTITAKDTATNTSSSPVVIDTLSNPTPTPPNTVAASANPSSIPADGATTSVISAVVTSSNGTAVSGDPVQFTFSGAACPSTAPVIGSTDGTGTATTNYTASKTPGDCSIGVTEANSGATGSTSVTQTVALNRVSVTPSATTVLADGTSTLSFTATVTPPYSGSTAAANDPVTFSVSGSPAAACGGFVNPTGNTGSSSPYTYTATYTSSTTSGFCTVTATESNTGQSGSTVIDQTQNPTPLNTLALQATPPQVAADGSSTSTIQATVVSPTSTPVAGDTVMFSESGSGIGTLSSAYAVTNAQGVASVTYTASTTVGAVATFAATEANGGAKNKGAPVTVTQEAAPNVVTVAANPNPVAASGTSTVTFTVTNNGTGQVGDHIVYAASCGTLSSNFGTTGPGGTVTVTYTAPATSGFCTVSGYEFNQGKSGSTTITVTS